MASQVLSTTNTSANNSSNSARVAPIESVVLWSVSVLAILIAATVFGNILVCTAFYLCRELRNITNQFVVSLAVSDLLVGFGSMPMWLVYQLGGWPVNSSIYTWWLCLDIVTGTASIMNLVVISIDRYLAITSPYDYQFKLTKTRAKMAIMIVWLYSLTVAGIRASPFYSPSWEQYFPYVVATASFFVPLPIMIFCYVQIFRVAHEQAGKIRRQGSGGYRACQESSEAPTEAAERNDNSADAPVLYDGKAHPSYGGTRPSTSVTKQRPILTSQNSLRMLRKAFVADLKAAKTLAIVMGSFIVCWSPFIVMNTVYVSCKACIVSPMPTTAKWLHYSNSAMNPIIYTVLNRAFRDAFRRIIFRQFCYDEYANRRFSVSTLVNMFPRKSTSHAMEDEKNGNVRKMDTAVAEMFVCEDMLTVV